MNKWNYKFRYQVASCWLFILSYTTMHGSMNIKNTYQCNIWHFYTHFYTRTCMRVQQDRNM